MIKLDESYMDVTPPISPRGTGTPPLPSPEKGYYSLINANDENTPPKNNLSQRHVTKLSPSKFPSFVRTFETSKGIFLPSQGLMGCPSSSSDNFFIPSQKTKSKYQSFLSSKKPHGAILFSSIGSFHEVYVLEVEKQLFCIKTVKKSNPENRLYLTSEIYQTIEKTIVGYDRFKDLESPYFRMVKMFNRDSLMEDGYYKYEFIYGTSAQAKDLNDYFEQLLQDPLKYYIPDLRPDNVILPRDGGKPVLIDPSLDNFDVESLSYEDLSNYPLKHTHEWGELCRQMAHQLNNWFPNKQDLTNLLNSFEESFQTDVSRKQILNSIKKYI